jgi:CheY-like chemotaxis protein
MAKARLVRPGTIAELAKRLLLAKADEGDLVNPRGRAVFWIGAGASVSAGIPSGRALAGRLAQRIAAKLLPPGGGSINDGDDSRAHEAAFAALQAAGEIGPDHTLATAYGELFARLDATQQRDFVRGVIVKTNQRQINWSHLALGELVRQRIVHTLLTTNFDDLLLDGLVRCDQLPAIIDGVESLNRMDPRPPVPQLVYLHGSQHTYSPRNSTEAVLGTRDLAQAQGGLFGVLQHCSTLVVLGYAGNPGEGVMELLMRVCHSLPELPIFWVAHGQQDSLSEPAAELLSESPNAHLIAGQDADLFFRELLREARIGVPFWFRQPVDHLSQLAERIRVNQAPESSQLRDEIEDFRARLRDLQPFWEQAGAESQERRELRQLLLSDAYADVWERLKERELDDVRLLQMRADAAYELGRRGLADLLPQAVRDAWSVLHKLPDGSAAWALAQDRLGDALATMGERGDERALRDAVIAYDHALTVHAREAMSTKWASSRNNQGQALLSLAELWGDTAALEGALAAFRDALTVHTRDAMPPEWAATTGNLANVLQILGKAGDRASLDEAVAAYNEALHVQTKEQAPTDWAMTVCNRAGALIALGQRGNERALREAVRSLDEAAQVVPRKSLPSLWATIKNNQGAALLALGQRGDEDALRQAIVVFREALEVRALKAMTVDWAATSNNLGGALLALGMRGDDGALREAMEILSTAMELLSGEVFPAHQGLNIGSLAQRVFDELWRVASREPAPTPGMNGPPETTHVPAGNGRAQSRVMVVEDSEPDQLLITAMLRQCIANVDVMIHSNGEAALHALRHARPDLLILDLRLPDMRGQDVLTAVQVAAPRLPVLVYSGDVQEMTRLQRQQRIEPGVDIAILEKNDKDPDAFIRLVPTLFKRRQRDGNATSSR